MRLICGLAHFKFTYKSQVWESNTVLKRENIDLQKRPIKHMNLNLSLPIKAHGRERTRHVYFKCYGYGVHIHIGYGAL